MTRPDRLGLRAIARLLRPHAVGEGWSLAGGIALGIVVVSLQVLRPWPLKWIVDRVGSVDVREVALLATAYLAIAGAAAATFYWQTLMLYALGNRVVFRFRTVLFRHLLAQPLAFHESREMGELLTRVVYDTSRLRRGVNGISTRIVQASALFVATIGILCWVHLGLGITVAVGGTITLLAMRRRGRRIARASKRQRRKEGKLASIVASELSSVREMQAFGISGSAAARRFAAKNGRSLRYEQKVRRLAGGLVLRIELVLAMTAAVALWVGAAGVANGSLTAGDLVLFISYLVALRDPFVDFANQTARLGRTAACAERLAKIVERSPEIADREGAVAAPPLRGEIRFEDVTVRAPRKLRSGRKYTLHALAGEVPAGTRVAVVGPNGAGKSSLLRLVLRLSDPETGRVLIDGADLRDFQLESLRGQVSTVFQESVLPGLTVAQNIALGTPNATPAEIEAAARAARVHDLVERLPKRYETRVRQRGRLLSGGERQRLAIARAVLRNGRLWLLDEPTTGLDAEGASDITRLLLDLTRGRTTLWITHDPGLVRQLDHVLALDRGTLAFAGSPTQYLAWLAGRSAAVPGREPLEV
ncbi:MAG TPA: ABC transporter ATP-binding protein [Gemmatimonadaceae bacterium]|nr:ABC transporter ATP-binding protein [Gemmatimonadaceae bacterium]